MLIRTFLILLIFGFFMTEKNANALQSIQIPATSTHKYSIIWLHGLGADGHDFEGIVPELNLIDSSSVRFIFPHAPVQAITVNRVWKCVRGTIF